MKTLPAGWSAYIGGSFTVAYMIQISCRDAVTFYRWGTIASSDIAGWTGDSFLDGRIAKEGLGSVSFSANLRAGGGLASVGDFNFKLLNHDNYYADTLANQYLDNADVQIRRFIIEASPTSFSSGLLVFSGIIADYWFDQEYIYFRCKVNENEHTTIPRKVIEEKTISTSAFGATRIIPDNSNGKPIPIQFGEIAKAEAFFCNTETTVIVDPSVATGGGNDYLDDSGKSWTSDEHATKDLEIIGGDGKGQILVIESNTATRLTIEDKFQTNPAADGTVYRVTDSQFDMIVSDSELKEFVVDENGDYNIWFWDNTSKIYVACNKKIITLKNNSDPFTPMAGLRFIAGVVKKNEITFFYPHPFTELRYTDGWTNPNNIIDWDNSSYASYEHTGSVTYTLMGKMGTDLHDVIGTWDKIYLYVVAEHNKAGWRGWLAWPRVYNTAGNTITGLYGHAILSDDYLYFNNILKYLLGPPAGFPASANAKLSPIDTDSAGVQTITPGDWGALNYNRWILPGFYAEEVTGSYTIKMYQAGLIFAKTVTLNEQTRFFVQIKGRMFASTWGGRKTAANLIENPADVIEKILRTDLGVIGTNIDTTHFDSTNTARTNYKLSYSINKEINTLEEIGGICRETMMLFWKDANGKHTLRPLDLGGACDKALAKTDVLLDNGVSTFGVKLSPLEAIYNEVYVHYDKDPATGDYKGVKFVKTPSGYFWDSGYSNFASEGETYWDYCHASYSRYGFTHTQHFNLDRVVDATTAEKIAKKVIEWLFFRVQELTFETQLQNCNLEIADNITLGPMGLDGVYKIFSIDENLSTDRIKIQARKLTILQDFESFERITEEGDTRVTEDGNTRMTEELP